MRIAIYDTTGDSLTHDELKKLLLLLRKNGVLSYESEGVKLSFSPDAMKLDKPKESNEEVLPGDARDPWSGFPTGELTPTQLAFYSAGGDPTEDPERADS